MGEARGVDWKHEDGDKSREESTDGASNITITVIFRIETDEDGGSEQENRRERKEK